METEKTNTSHSEPNPTPPSGIIMANVYSPQDAIRQMEKALLAIELSYRFTSENSEKDDAEYRDKADPVRLEFVAATSELQVAKAELLVAYRRIKKIRDGLLPRRGPDTEELDQEQGPTAYGLVRGQDY